MIANIMPEATPAELKTIAVRDLRPGDKIIHKYLATGDRIQREQIMEVIDVQPIGGNQFKVDHTRHNGDPIAWPVVWSGGSQFYAVKEWA